MSWKKKLGIILPLVCVVAAVALYFFMPKEPAAPKIIEPPFDNLYWGMTVDEARQVLKDAGIEKVAQAGTSDFLYKSEIWTLTAEQAELLGYEPFEEAGLSTKKFWPVHIGFTSPSGNKSGVMRLVTVSVVTEVDASKAATLTDKMENVRKEISKVYGEPYNERQTAWTIGTSDPLVSQDPWLVMMSSKAVGANETLLRYYGHLYVMKLYDDKYAMMIEASGYM